MASNYDNAAWFYDRLSRLVFGKSLIKAQASLLPLIPINSRILIAGGGTGHLIEDLGEIYPSGLHITYVEISEKMMALAKQRYPGDITVVFINAPIEEVNFQADFDIVITPFLLDSLPPKTFEKVFVRLNHLLKPDGLWLNTDFQLTGKWWQPILLKIMFWFFKLMGCVEVTSLPLIKQRFADAGLLLAEERNFFGDFISSSAYKKP